MEKGMNKFGRHYPMCKVCGNERRPEDVLDSDIPNCICDRTQERKDINKAVRQYIIDNGWIKNGKDN